MINKYLMTSEYGFNGVYRAKLLMGLTDSEIRAFIPGISSVNPFNSDGTISVSTYESNKESFPIIQWCCYNIESKDIANIKGPAWIMFENGDVQRPVCISYAVIGGEGESSNGGNGSTSSGTNITISGSFGEWITKWTCTVYGNTASDDNGICGWNGINYHTIKGCHVAIPISCITGSDDNFPEFSQGYGTVLEVRNPKNGKSVVVVVADCGNFGPNGKYNNTAALDLPPNTQNALDIHDSQSIEYRYIGHVSSWGGEQLSISDFNTSTINGGSGSSAANNAVSLGYQIIQAGVPYVWGGKSMSGLDCSGFIWYCYNNSKGGNLSNLSYADTDSMKSTYTGCGFKDVTSSIDLSTGSGLISGDVLVRNGHTDMYAGNGKIIGAHSSSTGIYESTYKGNYSLVLRYGG